MMRLQKYYIVILLYLSFVQLTGCNIEKQGAPSSEKADVQVVLETYKDSLQGSPQAVISVLGKKQHEVTDSLEYYKLANVIVRAHYFANQTDSSFLINQQVIDYGESHVSNAEAQALIADAYNSRGVFLTEYSLRDTAIVCFQRAYALLNESAQKEKLPDVCINLADCYQHEGDYTLSSYYYRKALTLADSLQLGKEHNYAIFTGIAKLYHELENYDLAETYYEKAKELLEDATDYERFFFNCSYGNYYYVTKAYDKSLACFREANQIARNFTHDFYRGLAQGNMGELFVLKEQPDSARHYLNLAKQSFGESFQQPSIKFYMEGLYASLALLEGNLTEAERLLMQPYDASHINPQYLYYHHKRLHDLYLKKNDFRKAYQYHAKTVAYDDSLRHMKIRNSIAEIDSRYRQDTILIRKDMQIALTESKASQWQSIAFLSIIFLILFITLITGIIIYRRKSRELNYQKQLTTITGLRMEIVRNRLSPHFMFNALNTVMPTLENYRELEEPFRLLIQLLRNNLQASEQIAISLENEISLVKDYLRLRTLKDTAGITVDWQINQQVPMNTLIPSMSIQIPVENALKYAFTAQTKEPCIRIVVTLQHRLLNICIEDNGIGCQATAHMNDKRGTGNGLKMLHRTIEILNTKNEEKAHISIESRKQNNPLEEGTRVSLLVPLHYTFEL